MSHHLFFLQGKSSSGGAILNAADINRYRRFSSLASFLFSTDEEQMNGCFFSVTVVIFHRVDLIVNECTSWST